MESGIKFLIQIIGALGRGSFCHVCAIWLYNHDLRGRNLIPKTSEILGSVLGTIPACGPKKEKASVSAGCQRLIIEHQIIAKQGNRPGPEPHPLEGEIMIPSRSEKNKKLKMLPTRKLDRTADCIILCCPLCSKIMRLAVIAV